jgi:hypothetical protein
VACDATTVMSHHTLDPFQTAFLFGRLGGELGTAEQILQKRKSPINLNVPII